MNRSSLILSAVLLATACSAAPDALVDRRWVAAEVGGTPAVPGTELLDPAANSQESRLFAAFAATHSYRQEGPNWCCSTSTARRWRGSGQSDRCRAL